jgi:hypothetical protein
MRLRGLRSLVGAVCLAAFTMALAGCAAGQMRPVPASRSSAGACPVPSVSVDTSGWTQFRARNAPFDIRLPSNSKDMSVEYPKVDQTWAADSAGDPWFIVYVRPNDLPAELDPSGEPRGAGVTRSPVIQYGPCSEPIGGREATVWVGEWVTRGIHSSFPHQALVTWELASGRKLYVLGQARSPAARDRALAALRTIRVVPD